MNLKELKRHLIEKGIPRDAYEFEIEYPNEAFCIHFNGQKWEVYYSERGLKTNLKYFEKEESACAYFYSEILNPSRKYPKG